MAWDTALARDQDYDAAMQLTRDARVERMFLKEARAQELFKEAAERLLPHARCEDYGAVTQLSTYMTVVDIAQRSGQLKLAKEAAQEAVKLFTATYPDESRLSFDMKVWLETLRLTLFKINHQSGADS